jgi:tetratricopeptide (TPR) repeat protein
MYREAYLAVLARPLPDSPYERLHRGQVLLALGQPDRADAELAAAVELRPGDADVWLTRARVFAKLGQKERAKADLVRAQQIKADEPLPWIETGRLLAELGEQTQADAAFARAAALAKGELHRFLEAGWWVAGPYPDQLDLSCPPEINPDPSKPVAAVGENRNLTWQKVATDFLSGNIEIGGLNGVKQASFYALAYAYADRDRTASLYFRVPRGDDARLWVNGKLAFDGFGVWKLESDADNWVPVAFQAGRNTVLVKIKHTDGPAWCDCQLDDHPVRRAYHFRTLGLWSEAADAYGEAAQRAPPPSWREFPRLCCLLAAGRDEEYRRGFAELVRRFDRPAVAEFGDETLANGCHLPPEKSADRDRWVQPLFRLAEKEPNVSWRHYWLGHAYLRAGRLAEAEASLRRAIQLGDELYFWPVLATTLHYLGRQDEARATLQQAEQRHAKLVAEALHATPFRMPQWWDAEQTYQMTVREARALILGPAHATAPEMPALLARGRQRWAELGKIEDDFDRLVVLYPDQPRLWAERGRRLGELGRLEEASASFTKAIELAVQEPQVWKERGQVFAKLGKWDEAAADFNKALDLIPEPKLSFPTYPWVVGRGEIDDQIARWEETFGRIVELRPNDSTPWARRVEHFAARGQWGEAEATLKKMVERFPDDWWASCLLAKLLLARGDVDGYRQVCRQTLDRFAGRTEYFLPINVGRAALLAPVGFEDHAVIRSLLANADKQDKPEFWMQATAALAEYRRGDGTAALKRLDTRVPPVPEFRNTQVMTDVVRALACQKAGRPADARAALVRAKARLARHRPRPEDGWAYDGDWHNWVQVEILVREAEGLIPDAPAVAAGDAGSPAQDEAARRERKVRADRLSTQLALALIRVNVGPQTAAEADLRRVLAQWEKLAAEEPANLQYPTQVANTRLALGRVLAATSRAEEGLAEVQQATTLLQKVAADPKGISARAKLADCSAATGDIHGKADRLADAARAWRAEIEWLDSLLKADPTNKALAARLAAAEHALGMHYAEYGLFREAAPLLARSLERSPDGSKPERWLRTGQTLLAAGDEEGLRRLCRSALARFGGSEEPAEALVLLCVGAPALTDDFAPLETWTAEAVRRNPATWVLTLPGLLAYREGRFAEAIRLLDTTEPRLDYWRLAVVAMAHHQLGHPDQAKEWLARSAKNYAGWVQSHFAGKQPKPRNDWFDIVQSLQFHREAHALITGQPLPPDPAEQLYRAQAYLKFGDTAKAEAEFGAAVETRPGDPTVWLARSKGYAAADSPWRALWARAWCLTVAEKALVERPDDAAAAGVLAELLSEGRGIDWTVLTPSAAKSEGGATLTVQPDGSVLASGTFPDRDVYTIEAEAEAPILALRLEVLPDPSLPKNGPGRNDNGNFILTDLRLTVGDTPVTWARASADYSQTLAETGRDQLVAFAIDADETTGWAVWPRVGVPHWAVFVPDRPVGATGKTRLSLRMVFRDSAYRNHLLGRFRLSVQSDSDPVRAASRWVEGNGGADPQTRVSLAYLARGDARRAATFLIRVTATAPTPAAAQLLVLALAQQRLGEKELARQAYRRAASQIKPVGDDLALRLLVRTAVTEMGDLDEAATVDLNAALKE